MKLQFVPILLLASAGACRSAELRTEFEAGRECYTAGEFRKAVSYFHRAVDAEPDNPELYFWLGKSYEVLSNIAAPLGGRRSSSKARAYLAKALELSPNHQEYRRELFDFLVNSAEFSRSARHEAQAVLLSVPEPDPDFQSMRWQLQQALDTHSSAAYRLGRLFLLVPQQFVRVIELPASGSRVPRSRSLLSRRGDLSADQSGR